MQKERASKKQQELLSFVDGFIKGNGYGPSYREIMRALGYKSVSTVAIHIDNLIAKGYLSRGDNSARSLEVVSLRTASAAPAKSEKSLQTEMRSYIASLELDSQQKQQLASAMELLKLPELAEELTNDASE